MSISKRFSRLAKCAKGNWKEVAGKYFISFTVIEVLCCPLPFALCPLPLVKESSHYRSLRGVIRIWICMIRATNVEREESEVTYKSQFGVFIGERQTNRQTITVQYVKLRILEGCPTDWLVYPTTSQNRFFVFISDRALAQLIKILKHIGHGKSQRGIQAQTVFPSLRILSYKDNFMRTCKLHDKCAYNFTYLPCCLLWYKNLPKLITMRIFCIAEMNE